MPNYNFGGGGFDNFIALPTSYLSGIYAQSSPPSRGLLLPPFDTGLYGAYTVTIPVSNGPHNIQMWFNETGGYTNDQRVFTVKVNGYAWLPALDVYKEAGGANKKLPKSIDTYAVGGLIVIEFVAISGKGNPFANAILLDNGLSVEQQMLNELQKQTPLIEATARRVGAIRD